MTLESIYFIAQIVSAAAIIVSLVFVGIQIRQNTEQTQDANRIAKAQMHQQIADSHNNFMMTYGTFVEGVGEAMHSADALRKLPRAQLEQFTALQLAFWKHLENVYYQHKSGFVSDEYWSSTVKFATVVLYRDGVQSWWKSRRDLFADEFISFIESQPKPDVPLDIRDGVQGDQA